MVIIEKANISSESIYISGILMQKTVSSIRKGKTKIRLEAEKAVLAYQMPG